MFPIPVTTLLSIMVLVISTQSFATAVRSNSIPFPFLFHVGPITSQLGSQQAGKAHATAVFSKAVCSMQMIRNR